MRYFALASILYSLAVRVHAAPAPQVEDATNLAGTLLGPDGFCSSTGDYWNGFKYVPCAPTLTCKNNICDRAEEIAPAGVSATAEATAEASASNQVTEAGAGAGDGMTTLATTETAVGSDSVSALVTSASAASVTEVQAGASDTGETTTTATGAVQTGSGTTTDDSTSQSGSSTACVDVPTNPLLDLLQQPPIDKWETTGPECTARSSTSTTPRFVAYWSQWSTPDSLPSTDQLAGVTHLVLSFAATEVNATSKAAQKDELGWASQDLDLTVPGPFDKTEVDALKKANSELKVLAAFGGWALDVGFSKAAATGSMETLAQQIVDFKNTYGLDGVDLDWEFPVGNGAFYKSCNITTEDHKLPERPYEADAYVDLVRHIRHFDPDTILSVAVPARKEDRELAFSKDMVQKMDPCLDEWNLMTYDAMNRRDDKAAHHAGSAVIKDVVEYYQFGDVVDKKKMNIGFPNYAKYFTLANATSEECTAKGGIGCPIYPAEGPAGQDIGVSGAWQFNEAQWEFYNDGNDRAKKSWPLAAAAEGTRDEAAGASSWVDKQNRLFWTWTSPEDIEQSCADHLGDVGGIMVWSVNQDTNGGAGGPHMAALSKCVGGSSAGGGDEGTTSASASASASDSTSATAPSASS